MLNLPELQLGRGTACTLMSACAGFVPRAGVIPDSSAPQHARQRYAQGFDVSACAGKGGEDQNATEPAAVLLIVDLFTASAVPAVKLRMPPCRCSGWNLGSQARVSRKLVRT